jgi:hypothetical protein
MKITNCGYGDKKGRCCCNCKSRDKARSFFHNFEFYICYIQLKDEHRVYPVNNSGHGICEMHEYKKERTK